MTSFIYYIYTAPLGRCFTEAKDTHVSHVQACLAERHASFVRLFMIEKD